MSWLSRLLCRFGWHCPPRGVDPRFSIYFYCDRCGDVRPGAIAQRVRASGRRRRW